MNYKDVTVFLNRVIFRVIPDVNGDKALLGVTTPTVENRNVLVFSNIAPLTVTALVGGTNYQTVKLVGDGQTTIQNNSTIIPNTGANKLLASNKVYNFTLISGVWLEDAD